MAFNCELNINYMFNYSPLEAHITWIEEINSLSHSAFLITVHCYSGHKRKNDEWIRTSVDTNIKREKHTKIMLENETILHVYPRTTACVSRISARSYTKHTPLLYFEMHEWIPVLFPKYVVSYEHRHFIFKWKRNTRVVVPFLIHFDIFVVLCTILIWCKKIFNQSIVGHVCAHMYHFWVVRKKYKIVVESEDERRLSARDLKIISFLRNFEWNVMWNVVKNI